MSWRHSTFEDLHRIVLPNDPTDADLRSMLPDTEESRNMLYANAMTWFEEDEILAIVGVAPMWKGVGTVWTLLTAESKQRGVVLTRGVTRFIDMLYDTRGYWRLQATVEHDNDTAQVWIHRLGFHYEGTMTAYGPDSKTHDLYARVVN